MGKLTESAMGIITRRVLKRTGELIGQNPTTENEELRILVQYDPTIKGLLERNRKLIGRKHRNGYPSE